VVPTLSAEELRKRWGTGLLNATWMAAEPGLLPAQELPGLLPERERRSARAEPRAFPERPAWARRLGEAGQRVLPKQQAERAHLWALALQTRFPCPLLAPLPDHRVPKDERSSAGALRPSGGDAVAAAEHPPR
jgi:hypothetical protein